MESSECVDTSVAALGGVEALVDVQAGPVVSVEEEPLPTLAAVTSHKIDAAAPTATVGLCTLVNVCKTELIELG